MDRRKFLKSLGVGVATTATGNVVANSGDKTNIKEILVYLDNCFNKIDAGEKIDTMPVMEAIRSLPIEAKFEYLRKAYLEPQFTEIIELDKQLLKEMYNYRKIKCKDLEDLEDHFND